MKRQIQRDPTAELRDVESFPGREPPPELGPDGTEYAASNVGIELQVRVHIAVPCGQRHARSESLPVPAQRSAAAEDRPIRQSRVRHRFILQLPPGGSAEHLQLDSIAERISPSQKDLRPSEVDRGVDLPVHRFRFVRERDSRALVSRRPLEQSEEIEVARRVLPGRIDEVRTRSHPNRASEAVVEHEAQATQARIPRASLDS